MNQLNIARILTTKRREKGITQRALADYMGVTTASVSKWETGQSYPDIALLPQLAAYFAISVDTLLGYAPQMSREEIRVLYRRLAVDFARGPFDTVMDVVRDTIRMHYTKQRLESACAKALDYTPKPSYKAIQAILKSGQDRISKDSAADFEPSEFGFTRGADYYKGGQK